jgi:hypothetical protein
MYNPFPFWLCRFRKCLHSFFRYSFTLGIVWFHILGRKVTTKQKHILKFKFLWQCKMLLALPTWHHLFSFFFLEGIGLNERFPSNDTRLFVFLRALYYNHSLLTCNKISFVD